MPRYYFDTTDGDRHLRDDEGTECPDLKAARDAAIAVLPAIARDELPNGDEHVFTSSVRDEAGRTLFRARLALTSEWVQ